MKRQIPRALTADERVHARAAPCDAAADKSAEREILEKCLTLRADMDVVIERIRAIMRSRLD